MKGLRNEQNNSELRSAFARENNLSPSKKAFAEEVLRRS
jgi:hypothetical protein